VAAPKLRAVLDTSVLVAGILQPAGPSGRVLRAFQRGLFTHVTSGAILDEMVDVLAREKIRRVTKLSRQDIANLRVALEQRAETASGEYKDVDLVTSDPKDNPIVSAALEMQAQYVVTLDAADLLRLKVFLVSGHRPVQVESPAGFLRLLGR
jgi:putative PIN family toxin of toxin-antitoxin system